MSTVDYQLMIEEMAGHAPELTAGQTHLTMLTDLKIELKVLRELRDGLGKRLVAYFGIKKLGDVGISEAVQILIDEKIIEPGDVVGFVGGDKAVAVPSASGVVDVDGSVDLKVTDQLKMGRIVRFVDNNGDAMPLLVSRVHGFEGVVSGHVFPMDTASRLVRAINHSIEKKNDTWHWPDEA